MVSYMRYGDFSAGGNVQYRTKIPSVKFWAIFERS